MPAVVPGVPDTRTRVVVVEDSPTQRAFLKRSLEADGDIVVVGEAGTAASAVAAVARSEPDVITVDLDIPGNGRLVIERILRERPRPILVLTGRTRERAKTELGTLGLSGGSVLVKPMRWDAAAEQALRRKVRALGQGSSRPVPGRASKDTDSAPRPSPTEAKPATRSPFGSPGALPTARLPGGPPTRPEGAGHGIVAIASSTGGPSALVNVLKGLAGLNSAILVVQHIGEETFSGLTDWLARTSGWPVDVAKDGDPLTPGRVVLGPPGTHLTVVDGPRLALTTKPVRTHMPSADEMFSSLARVAARDTVAAILTGMGADGAAGMLSLHTAGAITIAQDEATSVVFGMAKSAIELGGIRHVVPLDSVASTILRVGRGIW